MDTDPEIIRQEAEQWFARRRDGIPPLAEEAEFRRWRQRSDAHARAYADAERTWRQLAALQASPMAQRMADALIKAGPARKHATAASWRPLLLAACVAVVAVVGALRLLPIKSLPATPASYATALGEQRTERLEDGSRILLNTDTALQVRYDGDRREVLIEHGEAMFDVAHDAHRPFVVVAGDGTVTALGTRFQVRHTDGQIAVTLLQGSVEVARDARGERQRLSPGERAAFVPSRGGIALSQVEPAAALGWTQGRLDFDAAPLAVVVAEANRYSAAKLRLADPALGEMPISGTFQAGDNALVASGLEAVFPLRVSSESDAEIVLAPPR